MYSSGAGQETLAADAQRASRHAEELAGQQGTLVLGIVIATIAFIVGLVTVSSRPATVTITESTVSVRGGGMSAEVPRAAIDSVKLVSQITGLGAKRVAFQWGSVYAGSFDMRPFGKANLFVNTSRPPYVMIFLRTGVLMLNGASQTATQQLYATLRTAPAAAQSTP